MGYEQVKLFVKPSSAYPYEKINQYFVSYLNRIQIGVDDFLIGDMFNARELELWALFSDKTRDGHNMSTNTISILKVTELYKLLKDNKVDLETNKVEIDGYAQAFQIQYQKDVLKMSVEQSLLDLDNVQKQYLLGLRSKISIQQIYNDVKASLKQELSGRIEQMQDACGFFLATHLVNNQSFLDKVSRQLTEDLKDDF